MQHIKPVAVDVVGIHPRHARLLVVQIRLEPMPEARWRQLFLAAGLEREDDIEPMTLEGAFVNLAVPDADLEREVDRIEQRIRLVNARVALDMRVPAAESGAINMRLSQAIRLEAFSPDVRQRIEQARVAAQRISGVFLSEGWDPQHAVSGAVDVDGAEPAN